MAILNRLKIHGNNMIMVPGCEPFSLVSNIGPELAYGGSCKSCYVTIEKALAAIPGSYIMSVPFSDKYFVIPIFHKEGCNDCKSLEDYYKILRDLTEDSGGDLKSMHEIDYTQVLDDIIENYGGICW